MVLESLFLLLRLCKNSIFVVPAKETVQETLAGMRYMRKPLRVWVFYWVPAFAGTTNVGFLHSLESRNPPDFDGLSLLNRWQPNKHADFGRKVVL